jgi:HEPN domain-containing protein
MRPRPEAEGKRWLRQAEFDLSDARFTYDGKRYNLACFLAQQAAEKALKAFLFSKGAEQVWGHSVAELCEEATKFDPSFKGLKPDAAPLDKYYIPTRYPNGLPGGIPAEAFIQDDADKAIKMTAQVIAFVKARLI